MSARPNLLPREVNEFFARHLRHERRLIGVEKPTFLYASNFDQTGDDLGVAIQASAKPIDPDHSPAVENSVQISLFENRRTLDC